MGERQAGKARLEEAVDPHAGFVRRDREGLHGGRRARRGRCLVPMRELRCHGRPCATAAAAISMAEEEKPQPEGCGPTKREAKGRLLDARPGLAAAEQAAERAAFDPERV